MTLGEVASGVSCASMLTVRGFAHPIRHPSWITNFGLGGAFASVTVMSRHDRDALRCHPPSISPLGLHSLRPVHLHSPGNDFPLRPGVSHLPFVHMRGLLYYSTTPGAPHTSSSRGGGLVLYLWPAVTRVVPRFLLFDWVILGDPVSVWTN